MPSDKMKEEEQRNIFIRPQYRAHKHTPYVYCPGKRTLGPENNTAHPSTCPAHSAKTATLTTYTILITCLFYIANISISF